MVHTDGVHLLFVTLHTIGGTNVVSEDPSLSRGVAVEEVVGGSSVEDVVDLCQVSVNRVILDGLSVEGSHLILFHTFERTKKYIKLN